MDAMQRSENAREPGTIDRVGDLLTRIAGDIKGLASDNVKLAGAELKHIARLAAADAGAIVLAGVVALIGLGMLGTSAVAALEPVIPSLALRLLLMSVVYLILGGLLAMSFVKKLKRDVRPGLERTKEEAKETVETIREEVRHA